MSSATSAYAQIARPVKFFLVVTDLSGIIIDDLRTVTALDPATNNDGIITATINATSLLKDLGRQIVYYNSTIPGSPVTAVYRQVIEMANANTEGYVLPPAPFYVKVFDSTGAGVRVVRTG
jgi:hypothetical protein